MTRLRRRKSHADGITIRRSERETFSTLSGQKRKGSDRANVFPFSIESRRGQARLAHPLRANTGRSRRANSRVLAVPTIIGNSLLVQPDCSDRPRQRKTWGGSLLSNSNRLPSCSAICPDIRSHCRPDAQG